MKELKVIEQPGITGYKQSLALQETLLRAKVSDPGLPDYLILTAHSHVYTVGRAAPMPEIPQPPANQVPWIEVSRGGGATYHGPGQIIAYPVFDLCAQGKDIHVFLRRLEQVGIHFLAKLGIQAGMRDGLTGVWVPIRDADKCAEQWKKIASIGVSVRKWVTYHGMAINLCPDLAYFKAIRPCNQDGEVMTSAAELGAAVPTFQEIAKMLAQSFREIFAFAPEVASSQKESLKNGTRPSWLKVKAPGSADYRGTKDLVQGMSLHTVCQEAKCPNIGECWEHRTATFMIMGDECTRRCRFCAVRDGTLGSLKPLDELEPLRVAQAIAKLGLKHAVITSVNRDDLPDMGAHHFFRTVEAVAAAAPDCDIELLIPDMRGKRDLLEIILQGKNLRVLNHNIETVPRLYPQVRPGAQFKRSLDILRWVPELQSRVLSKSGIMVGLGETFSEVVEVMDALRQSQVQILTIGQYLQPSARHLPVQRFVPPGEFEVYKEEGLKRGFLHVESGPLVRSSYHAWRHVPKKEEQKEQEVSAQSYSISVRSADILRSGGWN